MPQHGRRMKTLEMSSYGIFPQKKTAYYKEPHGQTNNIRQSVGKHNKEGHTTVLMRKKPAKGKVVGILSNPFVCLRHVKTIDIRLLTVKGTNHKEYDRSKVDNKKQRHEHILLLLGIIKNRNQRNRKTSKQSCWSWAS